MKRKAILAAACGLFLAGNAYATTQHDRDVMTVCKAASTLAESIAKDRDNKVPASASKQLVDSLDQPAELSAIEYHLIDQVYEDWVDRSPKEIKTHVFIKCMGGEKEE